MEDVRKKRKAKTRLYNKVRLIVLAIIAIFLLTSTWRVYQKNRESRLNLAAAETQLTTLQDKQEKLTSDYAKIQTAQGKDEEIRKKFSVTKDGEQIAVIVDDKP